MAKTAFFVSSVVKNGSSFYLLIPSKDAKILAIEEGQQLAAKIAGISEDLVNSTEVPDVE